MVAHQAEGIHLYVVAVLELGQGGQLKAIVIIRDEHHLSIVPTLYHVVWKLGQANPPCSLHLHPPWQTMLLLIFAVSVAPISMDE